MNINGSITNLSGNGNDTFSYNGSENSTVAGGQFGTLLGQVLCTNEKVRGNVKFSNAYVPAINHTNKNVETASYNKDNLVSGDKDQFKALLWQLSGSKDKRLYTESRNLNKMEDAGSTDNLSQKLKDMLKSLLGNISSNETESEVQAANVFGAESTISLDAAELKKLLEDLDKETDNLEEFVMLLARLNLYINSSQSPQGTSGKDDFAAQIKSNLEDLISGDTVAAGSSYKNMLLQAISNLMAVEEVPQDIKNFLMQFETLESSNLEVVQAVMDNGIKAVPAEGDFSQMIQKSNVNENTEALTELKNQNSETVVRTNGNGKTTADNEELRELNYLEAKFIKAEDNTQVKLQKFYSMFNTSNPKAATVAEVQSAIDQKLVKTPDSQINQLELPNKGMVIRTLNQVGQAVPEESLQVEKMSVQSEESLLLNNELDNSNSSNSEEKFLKGLLDDKAEVKDDKVTLLMNQIKNVDLGTGDIAVNEKMTVNRSTFVSDIIKSVKFMENSQLKELRVSIAPKELGEIVITVTIEAGKMKTSIAASNKEAYNLLLSNAEEIKGAFNNNEIRIQDFSNSIYNGDTTFFKDGSQRQGNGEQWTGNPRKINGSGIEEISEVSLEEEAILDSQINILA